MERKIIKKEILPKGRAANRKESVNRKVSSNDKAKQLSANKNHFNSNLSHKKIFLKNPSKILSNKPTKIEIDSKENKEELLLKEREQEDIIKLEKELQSLKDKETSIDTDKDNNEAKLSNISKEIACQKAMLSHKKVKLDLIKEIHDKLYDRVNILKTEMDKLNSQHIEEPQPISLNAILTRLMMSSALESEPEENGLTENEIDSLHSLLYQENDNAKCVLCDFELCRNDFVIQLDKCSHVFHKECLTNYLTRHSKCPVCRKNVL